NSQSFDCKDERGGGLAYCSVGSPGAGMWNVQVVNAGASATDFQMTATVLGSARVAAADEYAGGVDQALTRTADDGVLANDQGTGRQVLEAKVVTLPEHG